MALIPPERSAQASAEAGEVCAVQAAPTEPASKQAPRRISLPLPPSKRKRPPTHGESPHNSGCCDTTFATGRPLTENRYRPM